MKDTEIVHPPSEARTVPVLMLGYGITAIGVLRSLSRAGITVYAIVPDANFVERSRFYRALPVAKGAAPTPATLNAFLATLSLPRAVLIACSDDWATAVAGLDGSLRHRFLSSAPPAGTIETFTDKWRFAQMLDVHSLPHPETSFLSSMAALEALPEADFRDRFLKPLASLEFSARHNVKAFLIKDKADAIAVMRRGEERGKSDFPILLQEYIPGPPSNHYFVDGFVDGQGSIRGLFARRRLRMFPPLFGNSTLMESVPLQDIDAAIGTMRRILAAVRYRGIFSAEFKFDDRDRQFKILEINARPWWYVEFAARSGVDVCSMAYRDALGLPVETAPPYRPGRRCVYLINDFRAHSFKRPAEFFSWITSWSGADETVFALDDPWPGIAHISKAVIERLRRNRTA